MRRIVWLATLVLLVSCGAAQQGAATGTAARPAGAPAMGTATGTATAASLPAAATAGTAGSGTAATTAGTTTPASATAGATASAAAATGSGSPSATAAATASTTGTGPATPTATATPGATQAQTATAAAVRPAGPDLTPGVWAAAGPESDCGTVLTSDLVAYGEAAGPITPATGGTLAVYVHNNTNLCHAAGRALSLPSAGWRLVVTALGARTPAAAAGLPAPPANLSPGAQIRLSVRVGAGLSPGWYTAAVQVPGAPSPPVGSVPTLQSIERFLVTAGPRPAGRVSADAYPTPTVGGLGMPLVSVVWSAADVAVVTVHAALACGPGTDRYASFVDATATAAGPGFTTDLPDLGSGGDPAVAQASWDTTFPGEATSLTLAARVQVRACGSGALLGGNGVAWKVRLPGQPSG